MLPACPRLVSGPEPMVATNNARVLLIDAEPQVTQMLRLVLQDEGYEVETADSGEPTLACVTTWRPELIVADLHRPTVNGVALCRRVRALSTAPIIVLSVQTEEATVVDALDAGADDYVIKPFGLEELLARVRAMLRRSGGEPPSFDVADFRVDTRTRRIYVCGSEVRLTPKEFELFVYFAQHPHCVLTHRDLLAAIWGEENLEQREYLRVFIGQLRKKLEPDASNPKYLITEPWIGYKFNPGG
jgi:two-component system KDP operon response regulator KdpE